jgi:hypothetical protein
VSTQEATIAPMAIFLMQAAMVVILGVIALQENGQHCTL